MPQKPKRSVFLIAAERQFAAKEKAAFYEGITKYSCDNISFDPVRRNYGYNRIEMKMYAKFFEPEEYEDGISDYAWWPKLKNGAWDHESRILALLLCAEMLRR